MAAMHSDRQRVPSQFKDSLHTSQKQALDPAQFAESNYTFRPYSRNIAGVSAQCNSAMQTQHSQSLACALNSEFKSNYKNQEQQDPRHLQDEMAPFPQ